MLQSILRFCAPQQATACSGISLESAVCQHAVEEDTNARGVSAWLDACPETTQTREHQPRNSGRQSREAPAGKFVPQPLLQCGIVLDR